MSRFPDFRIDNRWIASHRGKKNPVDPCRPYQYFNEEERVSGGTVAQVSTILLTNSECPFRCLMCDLWRNTTDEPLPEGAIPAQIAHALSRLPRAGHLKLYNCGSFFDTRAIPPGDYPAIARLVDRFTSVMVESHPAFVGEHTLHFRDVIRPELKVAIGLETVHPDVLPRLNKNMEPEDFNRAVSFLAAERIATRAFILLRPPFLSETEGGYWAKRSVDHAFRAGVESCSVIPVRSGNGALDALGNLGYFSQPDIKTLEQVIEYGIGLGQGPVLADLWDIERFSTCDRCLEPRKERLLRMNLDQQIYPPVNCDLCG